jgi:hypothetical protein
MVNRASVDLKTRHRVMIDPSQLCKTTRKQDVSNTLTLLLPLVETRIDHSSSRKCRYVREKEVL